MTTKHCWKCGKIIAYKGGNHRYCTDCNGSREHAHHCHACGEIIPNYHGHGQKYCDTCRIKAQKGRKKLWEDKYREYSTHFCVNCGKPIYNYQGHGQKYCRTCSKIIKKESVRLSSLKYYTKYRDVLQQDLGSSNLSQHANNDFDAELQSVRREMKRLGLDPY